MARRPVSESYQSVCSVPRSSKAETLGLEDEDDGAPIFSLSRSSMDVVMATGPPHKRDPAWTTMDMRRSSSTNTHSENHLVALKQLPPHMWQHLNTTNIHQMPLTTPNLDLHSPPVLSERWIANVHRWSQCSSNTHSRSSTPDTIVWRDGTSRPLSLTQETSFPSAPDSQMSKPTSPTTKHSPSISPLQTPNLLPEDVLASSPLILSPRQRKDLSLPTSSPILSPHQVYTSSSLLSNSPNLLQITSTEDEAFLENNPMSFTFPSPIPSSVCLADGGASSDHECLADDVAEELCSPGNIQSPQSGGVRSPVQNLSELMPKSPAKKTESVASFIHLELPWEPGQHCPIGQGWKSPLVCSVSDSQLGKCCRCNVNTREGTTKAPMVGLFTDEGTMTSQPALVDVAVQTLSPVGSLWGLRRNISSSNMGSHSILGSPPGSRLNLKSSVGSNSNLVSPSSSMFPISSGDEEEKQDDQMEKPSSDLERRRSCLKSQLEDRDLMRRSSMKQVQWDEDGMTWDIHGASPDPEVLSTAIQKHLEDQSSTQPTKHASKKKKAPKPPVTSDVAKATVPEPNPPVVNMEGENEEASGGTMKMEEKRVKQEEIAEVVRRLSRAEVANAREEDEVYREEGSSQPKSPSRERAQTRKRSAIRSLRRPGWCGASRKADD